MTTADFARQLAAACLIAGLLTTPAPAQSPELVSGHTATGAGHVTPEQWGNATVTIVNPTDRAAELLTAVSFDSAPRVQFAKEVWLPPRSRRTVRHAVRAPDAARRDAQSIEATSLLIDDRAAERALDRRPALLPLRQERMFTGIVRGGQDAGATAMIASMRAGEGLDRRVAYMTADRVPHSAAALGSLDALVLAGEGVTLRPEQRDAVRSWLIDGGKLLISLPELDPDLPGELLGDAWSLAAVDRVPLLRGELRGPASAHRFQRSEPVTLHRVTPGDMTVTHRVDGWPAALHRRIGDGELFVVALAPDAWLPAAQREAADEPTPPTPPPTPPLAELGQRFYADDRPLAAAMTDPRGFAPFVRDRIGYRVAPRGPVVALLLALPLTLAIGAAVWARHGRLERVGALGVAASLGLGGAILLLGLARADDVPRTLASLRIVRVAPEAGSGATAALLSLYTPTADDAALSGRGGVAWPDLAGQRGRLARMVWSDLDRWRWDGLAPPPRATLSFQHHAALELSEPGGVTVSFDQRGMIGQFDPGSFTGVGDALLVTPSGAAAPRIDGEGRFVLEPGDALPAGSYIRGAALSQAQQRRQDVYRTLADDAEFPGRPMLLAFADGRDPDLAMTGQSVRRASALVAWPVAFERPEPGSSVALPAVAIPSRPLRSVPGAGPISTLFDPRTRTWVPASNAGTVAVRFEPPQRVLPLRVTDAALELEMDAAGREVEVIVQSGGALETVARLDAPRGVTRVDLGDLAARTVDERTGVVVLLRVGDRPDPASPSIWRLRDLSLTLRGVTEPATHPRAEP